jgi:hypothetical protein
VIGFVSFPAKPASPVSSTRTVSLNHEAAAASLYDVTIGVSNEIGDSSVDCQNYIAFVIEVVGVAGGGQPLVQSHGG